MREKQGLANNAHRAICSLSTAALNFTLPLILGGGKVKRGEKQRLLEIEGNQNET